jgi:hypothetical protein
VTPLRPHPSTPERAWSVEARADRTIGGELRLRWVLQGALGGVRLPEPGALRRGEELWRHTCFEAFVGVAGDAGYHELNLVPSGEWTIYAFDRYRDGGPLADVARPPRVVVGVSRGELELDALIDLDALSRAYATAPLRLALAAVVEETNGALSYWALHHPPGAPDFHHGDGFVLRLEPPGAAC